MNSKTTILAAATAALLTAASVTAASAQTQERNSTRMNAGHNLSTGGQMNAQGPSVNSGQKVQGNTSLGRNDVQATTRTRSAMTTGNKYGGTYGRDRDRDRFAYGRDRDRDRFAYG